MPERDIEQELRVQIICLGKAITARERTEEWLAKPQNAGSVFAVPRDKVTIAGYVAIRTRGLSAKILQIAVVPSRQRLGIATELIWHVAKQGIQEINRGVDERNLPMQLLLKKLGFTCHRTIQGNEKDFYCFQWQAVEIAKDECAECR